jgi:hypothetical protein
MKTLKKIAVTLNQMHMIKNIDKINLLLLYSFVMLVFMSGCTHYYYAPNMHNVPLFKEKNEVRMLFARSSGDEFEGTEIQGAYAITNNIGVMANGFLADGQYENNYGKGYLVEIGTGYFKPLDKKVVFETFGGIGKGYVENGYGDGRWLSVKFMRYFIQPSIGFTSKYFDVAFSPRFSCLNFGNTQHSLLYEEYDVVSMGLNNINNNKCSILFEPAFIVRGGWKFIKLQAQLGLSSNLNNPDLKQEDVNISIGAYFSL